MLKLYPLVLLCLAFQIYKSQPLNWLNPNQIDSVQKIKPSKIIMFDIYAKWCGPCKLMDRTYTDVEVKKFVDSNFIAVKLDAESRETYKFQNQEYTWKDWGKNGINMLAYKLLDGQMRYPSTVFMDENGQLLTYVSGYFEKDEYLQILKEIDAKIKSKVSH